MARFLVSAMPFTGHVRPMREIAAALIARGHQVRFYTGSSFRAGVEAVGATLVPWQSAPDFDENNQAATFPRLVGAEGFRQLIINVQDLFIETIPGQVADLDREWARQPWDAVVGDEMSLGGSFWSEREGTPWATVTVLPLNLASSQGSPSTLGLPPGTNPITKLRDAVLRALVPVLSRPISGPLARVRATIGSPARKGALDTLAFSPTLVAASGSPLLDYGRTDRQARVAFVGELRAAPTTGAVAASTALPPWWADLDDRTVVLVTQGTQNIDPDDLIRPTLEALAERDVLVVAVTGVPGRDTLPFPVPDNARVHGFVPYDALLPRVHTVVTNGGWGGTLAALAHDRPLVVAGGDLDKPDVAARVAWSGAGVNLRTGTPSPAQVAKAYDRVTSDASFRDAAARVGAELRSLGGVERAAQLLESSLLGHPTG